jgi:hypothetical protein
MGRKKGSRLKKPKNLWMYVSDDELELPLAVTDTARELADVVGVDKNTIVSAISHARERGHRSRYIKISLEEGDGEDAEHTDGSQ